MDKNTSKNVKVTRKYIFLTLTLKLEKLIFYFNIHIKIKYYFI